MNRALFFLLAVSVAVKLCGAKITPSKYVAERQWFTEADSEQQQAPSGTLPVLYIETVEHLPIDQKETYIDGFYWLDASTSDSFESVGSADEPLKLGIRGRGNVTWTYDKKPYKLKLDKKQSLMGMNKSKHYALLHYIGAWTAYFSEVMAFEVGRRLGMHWTPNVEPLEVVLNGEYIGLYFLAENVRVESTRVNVEEQEDLSDDSDGVSGGWLVEIDNYEDEYQIQFMEPGDQLLRLTMKSPEVLSEVQTDYITSQFNSIIEAVYADNKLSREWEELIDIDECVKEYIVQEMVHNYDAYNGSFYMHKDRGTKWFVGPLWDLNGSLDKIKDKFVLDDTPSYSRVKLMRGIVEFPRFQKRLSEMWQAFYSEGFDWLEEFAEKWNDKIKYASVADYAAWPQYGRENTTSIKDAAIRIYNGNIKWLNEQWGVEKITYLFDVISNSDCGRVLINGLEYDAVDILPGMSVDLEFHASVGAVLESVLINGMDVTLQVVDNKIVIENISEDCHVEVYFSDKSAINMINRDAVIPDFITENGNIRVTNIATNTFINVYDVFGRLLYSGTENDINVGNCGMYIVVIDGHSYKVIL